MNFLTESYHRLRLPSPQFWRKLRARALVAAGTLGTATAGLAMLPQDNPLVHIGTYCIAGLTLMLTGAATVASLAVDDAAQLPAEPTNSLPPTTP
ncbi:hypothetical protein MUN82_03855 [Hymenobacter aerilatus]|uniref:Uncharacterized protein n=1 Tax=Hymenobacter aerilatus TaxID=2932251 RepID=A0A8T9SZU8_9BACT|nr:hypothetical protein [Hymenobacter aerilatus]UOR06233.1 hypothetical protein MUN82_03855 [Hymenobacter aerilatus]